MFVCVLALRKLCVLIGIDCGLPVVSRHLIENGGPWEQVGLFWAWPGPSLPARLPVHGGY